MISMMLQLEKCNNYKFLSTNIVNAHLESASKTAKAQVANKNLRCCLVMFCIFTTANFHCQQGLPTILDNGDVSSVLMSGRCQDCKKKIA